MIRKQEKIVNDNLKRKRIYLEREKFDLMKVLRKSLEAESVTSINNNQPSKQSQKVRGNASDPTSRCPSTAGTKSNQEAQAPRVPQSMSQLAGDSEKLQTAEMTMH